MLRFTKETDGIVYEQFVKSDDKERLAEMKAQGWEQDAKAPAKTSSEDAPAPKAK